MSAKRDSKLTRTPKGRSTKENLGAAKPLNLDETKPRLTIRFRSVEERDFVAGAADAAGCSNLGQYLKELGKGYRPPSVIDRETQLELIHLSGLVGKQGGLIKMALEAGIGQVAELRAGLVLIEQTKAEIRTLIDKLDDRPHRS